MSTPPRSTRRKQTDFESFAETTSAAIFITQGHSVLYANPAAARCTGYTRDELLGMELWQIAHPNYQPALKQLGETHSWMEPILGRYELKIVTKGGEERWLDMTLGDIAYQGKPAVAVTAFDITERDRAERALRKARDELEARVQERTLQLAAVNERLQSVLGAIAEAYVAFDSDWRFLTLNQVAETKVFGRPASELIGNVVWDEYPRTIGQEVYRQYHLAVEAGQPVHFETPSRIVPGHWFEVHAYPGDGLLEVYFRDITERKQAEVEIASLAKFPSEDPNPVLRLNPAGEVLYTNETSQTLLQTWARTTGDLTLSYWRSLAVEAIAGQANQSVDIECGGRTYVFSVIPIVEAGYINFYGSDITARKQVEEALRESEERYRLLFDNSLDGILLTTPEGGIQAANAAACRMFGRTEQEICQIGRNGVVDVSDPHVAAAIEERARTGKSHAEMFLFRGDGTRFLGEVSSTMFKGKDGRLRTSMIVRDITERKQAEEALRESRQKYQTLIETTSDFIWETDSQGRYTYCSPQMETLWGLKIQDMLGKTPFDQMPADDKERALAYFGEIIRAQKPFSGLVTSANVIGGRLIFVETSGMPFFDADGKFSGFRGISRDITERKRAEERLHESEERYRTLFETITQGVVYQDADGKVTLANPAAERILGVSLDQMQGRTSSDPQWRSIHEDGSDFPGETHPAMIALRTGTPLENIIMGIFNPQAQEYRWVNIDAVPQFKPGEDRPYQVYATFDDITDRKRVEDALRQSEARFRVLSEAMPQIVWSADALGAMNYYNPRAYEYGGVQLGDIEGWEWASVIHPDDLQSTTLAWQRSIETGQPYMIEQRLRRADGEFRWHLTRGLPARDEQGRIVQWIGTATDIHDIKRIEQALRESEEKYRRLIENIDDLVCEVDTQAKYLFVNSQYEQVLGYIPDELLGHSVRELIHPDDLRLSTPSFKKLLDASLTSRNEWRFKHKNGEWRWFDCIAQTYEKSPGEQHVVVISRDVTERKKTEEELRRTRDYLENLFQYANAPIICWDMQLNITRFNHAFETLTGHAAAEVLGRHLSLLFPQDSQADSLDKIKRTLTEKWQVVEIPILRKDGEVHIALWNSANVYAQDGQTIEATIAQGQDITELKKKEDELARLNRTLRALSNSNQAMMRAQDESKYLEAVCQIVVEDCGYAMVWIGFAEEDEGKTVRPVASAGFEGGYLDALKITWADTERGRGPTGTAIRTGKPSGCRNMLTDPNFEPWRAEALKRGYASSVVLPLIGNGRAFGAITIYSRIPDSFSGEEIPLLTELANDLVYGITTLRLRAAHAQAEEALRLSEERYRALFTGMTEGFALHEILCDEQGRPCDYRFLEINPSFERLTGLKREDVIGKTHNAVLPNDDPRWVKIYGEVALTGQPVHFEDYSPALDRYYDVFAYCSAPHQFAVLFMDITARKQVEQEREQLLEENSRQRRLLEAMFDAVPDGVTVMIGPKLAFRLANPAYRTLIPQPEVDPIGKGYEELWADPDAPHRLNILHQVFNTGEPVDIEEQKRSYPNGQLRYFSFHARRLQWNEEYAVLTVLHETTETEEARRRADAAAQEAQRLAAELDATITAIADGVMIFDRDARILRMNPAAEQILGYSVEEHAMSLAERVALLQLETAEGVPLAKVEDTPVRWALRGETVHGFLISTRIRGEKRKWLAISAAPIRTTGGRALGAVVSLTDITELRLTQQDLEQANVQLRAQTRNLESLMEALRRARDELEVRVKERTHELAQANEELRVEIAERERVESQLRLQMTAVQAAANGIVITDRQGSIQWCNPAFTHITGYAGEAVLGQNLRLISSGQHDKEFYRQLWETILAGKVWRGEITNRRRDGRVYVEEQTIAPVHNEQGEITHFVAVKQDITERKQAEDRLERYNQDLLALSKAERDQRQLAETLTAANMALTQSLNLDTVLGTLLDYVEQLVPYDSANVMLLEAESRLAVRLARGYERWGNAESVRAISFDAQTNPVFKALLTTRQSTVVPDTCRQPGWEFRPGVEHVRSWLGVPLVAGGNVIGVYSLDKTEPGFFTPERVRMAEMLAGQAAVAIQNAWLFEQVRAGRERLQSLSRRLVEAQEAERHYVARELHDEAGQALTSLLFGLGQLELQLIDPRQVDQVAELKQMTNGVLEILHRLAIDLRPASLDHLGLVPAALQYVKAIGDRYGLIAQSKAVGFEGERLPSDVETALYRIVQEALTNIVRHAHATRVDVLLERRGERVVVVVEDNGCGFVADVPRFTQQGHLGLAGMQERAEMLGGSLVIESAAGAGTTVVVEVPYGNSYPHR